MISVLSAVQVYDVGQQDSKQDLNNRPGTLAPAETDLISL